MTEKQKSKSFVGICLFVSLAVNIFLAGVVFGRKDANHFPQGEKVIAAIQSFKMLSPEARNKAKALVKEDWPKIQEDLQDIRSKRQSIRALLEQEQYDPVALDESFAALRGSVTDMQETAQKLVVKITDELSPEERVAFLKALPKPNF